MNRKPFLLLISLITLAFSQTHDRIYVGTGEYEPHQNWHAILRFEQADTMNSLFASDQYTPTSTIPVKDCYASGVMQNFVHGIYLDESHDEMYTSTLFSNAGNFLTTNSDTAVGSIAVYGNISLAGSTGQVPVRHIFGDSTQLKQPHGLWYDPKHDMLYVANTFAENILVFHNASTRTGNTTPDRIISHPSLGRPVYVFVDSLNDRLFVTCMPSPSSPMPFVGCYNGASGVNGTVPPIFRVWGSNTRMQIGNQTTHNCWWNEEDSLLIVGHHTNEILLFDLKGTNLNPSAPTDYNLTPRVIRVNKLSSNADASNYSVYGLHYQEDIDQLWVAIGYFSGGPAPGSPNNVIRRYDLVSNPADSGIVTPDREIWWTNGNIYYPPQPIWLQRYSSATGLNTDNITNIQVWPNPIQDVFYISVKEPFHFTLSTTDGRLVITGQVGSGTERIDTSKLTSGIYLLTIESAGRAQYSRLVVQ